MGGEPSDGIAAQCTDPVQPLDRAQLLVDARTGQHPPVADEHHAFEPEAFAHLADLVGQGARVGGVAFVDFDGDWATLGVAQQPVDDLQFPLLAVARVPDASQRAAAPFEVARTDVIEHQCAVVQMALGQGAFDTRLTLAEPVHRLIEVLGLHRFEAEFFAQGGGRTVGIEGARGRKLRGRAEHP